MIVSSVDEAVQDQVTACFEAIGVAFQILDDLRDLYANKGRKQIGNDLREGKVSALAIAHLEECPEEEGALRDVLQKPFESVSSDEVQYWKERFQDSNAPNRCALWANSFVDKAIAGAANQPLQILMEQTVLALGLKNGGDLL